MVTIQVELNASLYHSGSSQLGLMMVATQACAHVLRFLQDG